MTVPHKGTLSVAGRVQSGDGECFDRMFITGPVPEQHVLAFLTCEVLRGLKERRSILLIEQNLSLALRVADYVCVMAGGVIELAGEPDALRSKARLQDR